MRLYAPTGLLFTPPIKIGPRRDFSAASVAGSCDYDVDSVTEYWRRAPVLPLRPAHRGLHPMALRAQAQGSSHTRCFDDTLLRASPYSGALYAGW